MEFHIFLVVVLSAMLHALWNAVVKHHDDKLATMGGVMFFQGLTGLFIALLFPFPEKGVWWFLFLSIVLHSGYNLFLAKSYHLADISVVYPIARGLAPLVVSFVAIVLFNEEITFFKIIAIIAISLGTIGLGFSRFYDKKKRLDHGFKPLLLIAATAFFISGYTLNDAHGAIKNNNAFSFIGWSLFMSGLMTLLISLFYLKEKAVNAFKSHFPSWALAGLMSAAAYLLVMWAVTESSIALVISLREIGIIFAIFYGVVFFKEKVTFFHLVASGLIMLGVMLIKLKI